MVPTNTQGWSYSILGQYPMKRSRYLQMEMRQVTTKTPDKEPTEPSHHACPSADLSRLPLCIAPAKRGFVSVGDVCWFLSNIVVMISEMTWSEGTAIANCVVCECDANKDMWNLKTACTLNCPVTELTLDDNIKKSCSLQRLCKKSRLKSLEAVLVASTNATNSRYLNDVHTFRLGYFICNKLDNILKSKYLRTTFNFLHDDRVFALFGLTKANYFSNKFLIKCNFHLFVIKRFYD